MPNARKCSYTDIRPRLFRHSSLAPDDIPIKLRCAICSKLAVNAFRLPCCEQAICESCETCSKQPYY